MPSGFQSELRAADLSAPARQELDRYLERSFDAAALAPHVTLPLGDEPFVACWDGWSAAARRQGAMAVLAEHLPQLWFPIAAGMSGTPGYQEATRRGAPRSAIAEATGLPLPRPERVELSLHAGAAGRIPTLVVRGRDEFVLLVQALARRNEPVPVPPAQGALMVAGFNNWARLRELRRHWEAASADERGDAAGGWAAELARLPRDSYQDRFLLLSDGPYSGVPAADLGLEEEPWRAASLVLRREHEATHYLTRRLFGSMRNHVHDELLADYAGQTVALGRFRADWQLRFLGLERDGALRAGGRLEIYRGDPPLGDEAFLALQALVRAAVANLERFDTAAYPPRLEDPEAPYAPRPHRELVLALLALALLPFADLAQPDGDRRLLATLEDVRSQVTWRGDPPAEPDRSSRR